MNSLKNELCNEMSVVQGLKNGILSGTHKIDISLKNGITASIFQAGKRIINIHSTKQISKEEIFAEFEMLEKLLMLFDGRFYPIEQLSFDNNDDSASEILKIRPHFYESKDFCQCTFMKLIEFKNVLTDSLFTKWEDLIQQMDIVHKVFLYALSNNKNTTDVNFAFLVELAEPIVELIQENTFLCKTLSPGNHGTTLKMCVDAIITHYGISIFENELNNNYSDFLDDAVGSRIRIMHIKKKQKKYFSGKDCVRYSMKFNLLYRIILLELLGVPCESYKQTLKNAVQAIDTW